MIHIPTGAVDVQPSGDFFMRKEQHLRLNALIRRYSSGSEAVIVGVYGTHVHSDSFKMYYDEKGRSHYLVILFRTGNNMRYYLGSFSIAVIEEMGE